MPVLPPLTVPPALASQVFWTMGEYLDFVRAILNDMQIDANGENFANDKPYVPALVNLAYDELQDMLEDANVESVSKKEWRVYGIPASPAIDPDQRSSLGYDGYFDGQNPTRGPWQLPQDLLEPMAVWERQAGSGQAFRIMRQQTDKFGGRPPLPYWGSWQWSENRLWFPCSTVTGDILIEGIPSLPGLVVPAPGQPGMQIPLARCASALAYLTAAKFCFGRGTPGAASANILQGMAQSQIDRMSNRSAKRSQGAAIRRPAYGNGKWRRRGW